MPQGRTLRERVAGQTAMSVVVDEQLHAAARGTLASMLGISPLTARSRSAYREALGELIVGDVLAGLGQNWDVLHDLPLGGDCALEHLVMGPAGIFAIRTAHYRDHDVVIDGDILTAAGEPHDDIEVCVDQADAAAQALSAAAGSPVLVQAMLVVVSPRRLTVRREPSGVRIAASSHLERVLARSPRVSTGEEVARISDLADLETTWPAASLSRLDTQRLHRQFAIVRSEVRSALVVRSLWAGVAFALCAGILWAVVAQLVTVLVSA